MTQTPSTHFDLIIVGTGSGNSIPGDEFDGLRIAIVEEGRFGGTCLNAGCIPTKMFVYAADTARDVAQAHRVDVHTSPAHVDWAGLRSRVFDERIDPIARGGEAYRTGNDTPNITVFKGRARFTGPLQLLVTDGAGGDAHSITGDTIVLATGSRPRIPAAIAESGAPYVTSDDVMRLEERPESIVIVGAGIVAVEFASVFSAMGTRVTVVDRGQQLLKRMDATLVARFNESADATWTTRHGVSVTAVEDLGAGSPEAAEGTDASSGSPVGTSASRPAVRVHLSDGSCVQAERLLVAAGRVNNSDRLNTAAAGIELTEDGRILTDDYGRATAPGVWALGDASNEFQLKHVANAEARAIAHNLRHPEDLRQLPHTVVPSAIFTHPHIATVGLTEEQARGTGRPITVGLQEYGDVAYGWAMNDHTGLCKIIADAATGEILGGHIMGPQATTLIQTIVTAMAFHIDAHSLARGQYWPHPALTEVVENALLQLDLQPGALRHRNPS